MVDGKPAVPGTPPVAASHGLSRIWKTDDWLAVWVGLLILGVLLAGLPLRLPDWKWSSFAEFRNSVPAWSESLEDLKRQSLQDGEDGIARRAGSLAGILATGNREAVRAAAQQLRNASADDAALSAGARQARARALKLSAEIEGAAGRSAARLFSRDNLNRAVPLILGMGLLGAACLALMGKDPSRFALGFPVVFLLGIAAFFIAGNATIGHYGLEFVFWALALGLLISNTVEVPRWLKAAANTELYIKIGLVLLGAEMVFGALLKAGAFGMIQAVLVIVAVWYFCFWLARRLGLDDEFGAILATGVSVCGVSAAIAAGGALKGDPRKVSHTISLVLIMAVPMLILQPVIARLLHLPAIVTGAWLGGTIDTTGAVVAAGSIAGDQARDMAVIIKMSQNALIGVVAFLLALWSTLRKKTAERPKVSEIWSRFPKFVLGFVAASLLFSLVVPGAVAGPVTRISSGLRGYFFCLAFVSIGLETRVKDLLAMEGGRPALTFIGAQAFNILWTLLIAGLLFGGLLFAIPRL